MFLQAHGESMTERRPLLPAIILFVLSAAACVGLVVLARFLPEQVLPGMGSGRRSAPIPFYFLGLGATFMFFLLSWVVPGLPVPPVATIALVLLSPLIQLDRNRTNLQGMAIVGLGMAAFLVLVLVLVRRRAKGR
jgi:hypothetical protein